MKQLNWYQIFGNIHTIPEGSTVTPTDDVQILLHCANIWDKSYTTIGEVIADDDTLFLTLIDNNAIDYLVRSTTFASSIVASESAMQYIGASDYASETLLSDSTWLTAIDSSAYKDYVINAKVPTMTSNTTPEGEVIRSSVWNSTFEGYCAFDNNASTLWQTVNGGNVGQYIGYKFVSANKIFLVKGKEDTTSPRIAKYKIQGSNDGFVSDTHDLTEEITTPTRDIACTIIPDASYSAYRLYITAVNANSPTAQSLQFYGRENAGVQSWLKAGGITNKKYTTVSEVLSDLTTLATLMSSSDAIDYLVTAKGWATEICSDSNAMADIGMNNYAANTLIADETWLNAIANSAYVESVMNIKVPAMTSSTQPYGIVSASSEHSGTAHYAWKAFNNNIEDWWLSADGSLNQWIKYEFISSVRILCAVVKPTKDSSNRMGVKDFKIQWSDTNGPYDFHDDYVGMINAGEESRGVVIQTTQAHKWWVLYVMSRYTTDFIGVKEMQFYGRKDI